MQLLYHLKGHSWSTSDLMMWCPTSYHNISPSKLHCARLTVKIAMIR